MSIAVASARSAALVAAGYENNPFVTWENLAAGATLTGTDVLADGAQANAVTPATSEYWLPDVTTTTANLSAELGAARTVSFAAIAAHNLADLGATVRIRRSTDGISWSDAGAGAVTPTDNRPIAWRMETSGQDAAHWQLYITGLTSGDPVAVGVFLLGDDLVFPERFYRGFSPVLTPTDVRMQSNISEGGNFLGSSVASEASTLSVSVEHVPQAFIRGAEWTAFQRWFNEARPCFFGWRPADFPEDIHYVIRSGGAIRPVNSGPRSRMSFEFTARVHEA